MDGVGGILIAARTDLLLDQQQAFLVGVRCGEDPTEPLLVLIDIAARAHALDSLGLGMSLLRVGVGAHLQQIPGCLRQFKFDLFYGLRIARNGLMGLCQNGHGGGLRRHGSAHDPCKGGRDIPIHQFVPQIGRAEQEHGKSAAKQYEYDGSHAVPLPCFPPIAVSAFIGS